MHTITSTKMAKKDTSVGGIKILKSIKIKSNKKEVLVEPLEEGKNSDVKSFPVKMTIVEKRKLKKQRQKERLRAKILEKEKRSLKTAKTGTNDTGANKSHKTKTHKGHAVKFNGKLSKQFHQVYEEEQKFIENVMKRVPKLGQHDENLEDYLVESDDNEVELKLAILDKPKPSKKRKHDDDDENATTTNTGDVDADKMDVDDEDDSDKDDELDKRKKFLQSLELLRKNKNKANLEPELSRDELKAKLTAKLEAFQQEKERTSTKPKKKKKEKHNSDDKKKQFISKPNPNVTSNKSGGGGKSNNVRDDTNSISSTASSIEQKTPLRKAQVVKSNGQVVYSKFDFISDDKYYNTKQYTERKAAPKPTNILKKVEKYEKKVANLETAGKTSEAVALTDQTKWATAMKRAQGVKVRDDPTLLKKTIKKETKVKDMKTKKWKERNENVEKQKQKVQEKRQKNIQERKDEKKKRARKLQRKRGRIA